MNTQSLYTLASNLTHFVQELAGSQWHTLAGFISEEAAFECSKVIGLGKRCPDGYIRHPMGRHYRVVDRDGRMVGAE